jgi:hypothetical protein
MEAAEDGLVMINFSVSCGLACIPGVGWVYCARLGHSADSTTSAVDCFPSPIGQAMHSLHRFVREGSPVMHSWRRLARSCLAPQAPIWVLGGQGASEHPHGGLGPEHDLLIRGQDQGLGAGHVVRLGADVTTGFAEAWRLGDRGTSPAATGRRQPLRGSFGYKQMHRDDADGAAGPGGGREGHGREGERPGRTAPGRRRPARGPSLRGIHVSP